MYFFILKLIFPNFQISISFFQIYICLFFNLYLCCRVVVWSHQLLSSLLCRQIVELYSNLYFFIFKFVFLHFQINICLFCYLYLCYLVTNSYLGSSAARLWNYIQICRKTANIADTNTKCKIWVRDARLENLPIFAESLEQPSHILQLRNIEIQKYLRIFNKKYQNI